MLSPQLHGRALVRWGIIGCGDVTEVKSGPGFRLAAGSQLVAVMRRDGARDADYARRHGVPRWYDDAGALLADPAVDAVYVATPPDTHGDYACRAAQAGISWTSRRTGSICSTIGSARCRRCRARPPGAPRPAGRKTMRSSCLPRAACRAW